MNALSKAVIGPHGMVAVMGPVRKYQKYYGGCHQNGNLCIVDKVNFVYKALMHSRVLWMFDVNR